MSKTTRDHDTIRGWAEARGGHPAAVKGTGRRGDPGILRIDFPGYRGQKRLREISWDDFFRKFDRENLSFIYQEKTKSGNRSNFSRFVSAETARRRGASSTRATTKKARARTSTPETTRTPTRAKKKTSKATATRRRTGTTSRRSAS